MKAVLLGLVVCLSSLLNAQIANDLEIYSESGEKFTLTMNGEVINKEPASRVKVENTQHDYAEINILTEDGVSMSKRILISHNTTNTGPIAVPTAVVYKLTRKKNKLKLKTISRSDKKVQNNGNIIIMDKDEE